MARLRHAPLHRHPRRGRPAHPGRGGEGAAVPGRPRTERLVARVLREQPPSRSRRAARHQRPCRAVHRGRRRARITHGRDVHRTRPRPIGGGQPGHRRGDLRATGRRRGRVRCRHRDRELRHGGMAPGRLSGQPRVLARAVGVDVRTRVETELRPVAPDVVGNRSGHRTAALRRPRRARAGKRHPVRRPTAEPIRVLRQVRRTRRSVGHRLVALPPAWSGRRRLRGVSSTCSTRAGSTAPCRSSTKTRCGVAIPTASAPASRSR